MGFDEIISDTTIPAPKDLHSWRNGRSVTPAIGANKTLLGNLNGPIHISPLFDYLRVSDDNAECKNGKEKLGKNKLGFIIGCNLAPIAEVIYNEAQVINDRVG
ncbi:hypothetical protein ACFL17_03990 [Pseudomonadota bacterium]